MPGGGSPAKDFFLNFTNVFFQCFLESVVGGTPDLGVLVNEGCAKQSRVICANLSRGIANPSRPDYDS